MSRLNTPHLRSLANIGKDRPGEALRLLQATGAREGVLHPQGHRVGAQVQSTFGVPRTHSSLLRCGVCVCAFGRQHARLEPDAVVAFIEENRTTLSALSVREATKQLAL
jgi:hypothetical protein